MKLTKSIRYYCQSLKLKIIEQTLEHTKSYGWNSRAIVAACTENNLSPASQGMISLYDVIAHVTRKWNSEAITQMSSTNFNNIEGVRKRISLSIKTRLSLQIPHLPHWHQAIAIGAHPINLPTTSSILWSYSDEIWRLCGDTSTDYNYYTKRTLFNSAYVSTELFLLTDKSQQFRASWDFLERRLDDILMAGKFARQAGTMIGAVGKGLWSLTGLFKPYPQQVDNPIERIKNQRDERLKQSINSNNSSQNANKL